MGYRMEISAIDRQAIEMCIRHNLPFAWSGRPGRMMRFFASAPDADECRNEWPAQDRTWNGFIINFFANDEEYVVGVRDSMDAQQTIDFLTHERCVYPESLIEQPCAESTDRLKYLSVASSIVAHLRKEGGKTVFSRVILLRSEKSVVDVALDYFSKFPDTFRYLCFTQETGLWLGATPETVADYTLSTGLLHTMALAGTVSADTQTWDLKNIEEHAYVTNYICSCLDSLGATEIMAAEHEEVGFGRIKHLCTPIKARLRTKNPRGMLYALSPTPAIAGTPRDRAISEIFLCETHSRLCYGGFVGLKEGNKLQVWANLRCATVRGDSWFVYAGGGLTARSVPQSEWDEGEAKTEPLRTAVIN